MAQINTPSNQVTIKIKKGLTAGSTPASLTAGELAVNLADYRLFVGGQTGQVIELIGASAQSVISGGSF